MSNLIFITAFRSVLHQTRNPLKSFGMLISAAPDGKEKKAANLKRKRVASRPNAINQVQLHFLTALPAICHAIIHDFGQV